MNNLSFGRIRTTFQGMLKLLKARKPGGELQ